MNQVKSFGKMTQKKISNNESEDIKTCKKSEYDSC